MKGREGERLKSEIQRNLEGCGSMRAVYLTKVSFLVSLQFGEPDLLFDLRLAIDIQNT